MVSRGPMARAVGSAIRAAKTDRLDAGTVQLARRYAELIDNAAPLARYVKHLDALRSALATLEQLDPLAAGEVVDDFAKLADALSQHSVASDLGPKLLAALAALGLTPAARRAALGGAHEPRNSGVANLRQRAASRAVRAAR